MWQHAGANVPKKKTKKESDEAILASVKKEMAEPRMVKSAWGEDVNQGAARIVRKATED